MAPGGGGVCCWSDPVATTAGIPWRLPPTTRAAWWYMLHNKPWVPDCTNDECTAPAELQYGR
jgi:hypothetical protein